MRKPSLPALASLWLCAVGLLVMPNDATAFLRKTMTTQRLLDEAAVIVVAHASTRAPFCATGTARPGGIEHLIELEVVEVLRGGAVVGTATAIPTRVHFGLSPSGCVHAPVVTAVGATLTSQKRMLFDDAGISAPIECNLDDDAIWFLWRSNGPLGMGPISDELSVSEPSQLQPIGFRQYFEAALSGDSERIERIKASGVPIPEIPKRPKR